MGRAKQEDQKQQTPSLILKEQIFKFWPDFRGEPFEKYSNFEAAKLPGVTS